MNEKTGKEVLNEALIDQLPLTKRLLTIEVPFEIKTDSWEDYDR